MGLFDFFSKKNSGNQSGRADDAMDLVSVSSSIRLPKVIAGSWPEIEKTRINFVAIDSVPQKDLSLEQSKFGHIPILPVDYEYPLDIKGDPMFLLAQINFAEMPALEGYPRSGYLQFYISASDDVYGIDFDDPQNQRNFRVLFFEEKDVEKYQADFSFLEEIEASDMLPIPRSYALKFTVKEEYFGLGDVRSEKAGAVNIDKFEREYPTHADAISDYLYDNFVPSGHKVGGYAYFTQEDPRMYKDQFKEYILLLQIDSDDDIMWGDCGVANFFIHPDDLQRKDFSKVMYNWDCS